MQDDGFAGLAGSSLSQPVQTAHIIHAWDYAFTIVVDFARTVWRASAASTAAIIVRFVAVFLTVLARVQFDGRSTAAGSGVARLGLGTFAKQLEYHRCRVVVADRESGWLGAAIHLPTLVAEERAVRRLGDVFVVGLRELASVLFVGIKTIHVHNEVVVVG